jgi:hypothetical protein
MAGARFSIQGAPNSSSFAAVPEPQFSRCLDSTSRVRGCDLVFNASSVTTYNYPSEVAAWSWLATPPLSPLGSLLRTGGTAPGLSNPSAPNVSLSLLQPAFNSTDPFAAAGLGSTVAGVYTLRRSVQGSCQQFIGDITYSLSCNSPPAVLSISAPMTIPFSQGALWGSVSLAADASPTTVDTALPGEADRDAPTTRFDWSVSFTSTAVPGVNVAGIGDAPASSELKLSGDDIALRGIQEAFTTSARYSGDLANAANSLYNITPGSPFAYKSGLPAADAICQYHAAAARLPFPQDFACHICSPVSASTGIAAQARFTTAAPVYAMGVVRGGFASSATIGGQFKVN